MNDGFFAVWLLAIGLILYLTGWQTQVADQTSRMAVAAFLTGVTLLHGLAVPIGGGIVTLQGSAAWALLWAFIAVICIRNFLQSLFVILCAVLGGAVWLWIRFMYATDPVFLFFHPGLDGAIIAGFLAGMLTERFAMQAAIIAIAASIAQFSAILMPGKPIEPITIGMLSWWDGAVAALAASRLTWNVKAGIRHVSKWFSEGTRERGGNP
ncbi:hypothetical protein FHS18_001315 [Paenibacillus phyllosphaerae]|uniref:Tyrosinase copper-binding domain-containing protein n=1 Tax=Paenibacillus phyllosphaerae TaxID=274593 RepID=A0A7W5AUY6_9BACL|nr:hypothetical protein [Paenibacillus phyllosphaerae]MBB3109263.1 hypothetical protein [Paenibacillus phyllosphaerae]